MPDAAVTDRELELQRLLADANRRIIELERQRRETLREVSTLRAHLNMLRAQVEDSLKVLEGAAA